MAAEASPLASLLAEELAQPAGPSAEAVARALRERHGSGVAAILLYGSCLRRRTHEGVLDFYVLVDGYRAAHPTRRLALLNALLPPAVFYREIPWHGVTLRAKVAVMRTADFGRRATGRGLDGRIWARFSQPSALVWVRDAESRQAVVDAVTEATLAMVDWMRLWLPAQGAVQRFESATLWEAGLRETYRAELRSERGASISAIHAAAPERYARVARAALAELAQRGRLQFREHDGLLEVFADPAVRRRARRRWRLRRPLAKAVAVIGLVKTAFTFGDWVPYAIWKLERHGGEPIVVSERQRRHPLLFGWPVLLRLLRRGVLR